MIAAQFVVMEHFIETALRAVNERAHRCHLMNEKTRDVQQSERLAAHHEAMNRTEHLKQLLERDWLQPDLPFSEADN